MNFKNSFSYLFSYEKIACGLQKLFVLKIDIITQVHYMSIIKYTHPLLHS